MNHPFVTACIEAYASLLGLAAPVVLFIGGCNIALNCIISAFMGHGLNIGGGK